MSTATLQPASVAAALRDSLATNASQTDAAREFPRQNLDLLAQKGLFGLLVPAEFGGVAAGAETFAAVVQGVGGACASTGMIFVMHNCAVETVAKHHANPGAWLQRVAQGKHVSTLACSERGTGANFYASDSTSTKTESGFALDGQKAFVTSGAQADSYVVSARAVGSDGPTNTTLYLVPAGTKGMDFVGRWEGLGLRGNCSVAMKLTDCRLDAESQIGAQGQGLELELGTILPRFLLGTAAVYNGIAEAALQATVQHVKGRSLSHTGEALADLPVMRNRVARMTVALHSSVALMNDAARAWDAAGTADLVKLLEAKQLACRTAVEVTTMGVESCGGIAYSAALPLERHLRDAQAGIVMAPTNDMLLDLIGKAALGLPLL